MASDKRGRRRRIPELDMPPGFDRWRRNQLVKLIDELERALSQPATAAGAVEALVILEGVIEKLTEYRAMLTAWAIDPEGGDVTHEAIASRIGRVGTTIGDRAKEDHIDRVRSLK